jgi:hypothetical protein
MKYLLGFPVCWVIAYLTWAFMNWSFYPGDWVTASRGMCVIFAFSWGVALSYRIAKDV